METRKISRGRRRWRRRWREGKTSNKNDCLMEYFGGRPEPGAEAKGGAR